jgi:hypothetical protein
MDIKAAAGVSIGAGSPELGWGMRNKRNFQLGDAYIAMKNGPMLQFSRRALE